MNIVILGAGQVGATLAENLSKEENDITLVDVHAEILRDIQDKMDVRTVVGSASYPSILIQAGIENADMLIAVTSSDETNLVACQIAYHLFNTPTKIARIRSKHYLSFGKQLLGSEIFAVDLSIAPEQIVADYLKRLIDIPGSIQVLDFAGGLVSLVAVKSHIGGLLVGKTLTQVREELSHFLVNMVVIFRDNTPVLLKDTTVIEAGDEIFFIVSNAHVKSIMATLRGHKQTSRRIIIAGGGNIGERLAMTLENEYDVKLIEYDLERAKYLSEALTNTTILQGDAADRELLLNENIDYADAFVSVTNNDEVNIMSCILAKKMGARRAMTLIARHAYIDLLDGSSIDVAVAPQQVTIGSILAYIRHGDIVKVHSVHRGVAETLEVIVHGDKKTSKVIGRRLSEITLPSGASIVAIVRQKKVIIPNENTVIEPEDHVIVFVLEKKFIHQVEGVFAVDVTFF